jgi:dolichyl-phosphate-mannose-protein mannosyltransferase
MSNRARDDSGVKSPAMSSTAITTRLVRRSTMVEVGGIFVAVSLLYALLAATVPTPWIVPDELIYSEMAKSIASGHLPAVRGETTFSYGPLYPLLISPAWLLSGDMEVTYAIAKTINALVMGSVVIPAFFLARRFVTNGHALVVAAFSGLVPSMLYTGTLLTEVALYPAFVLALLLMVRAVESPTRGSQMLALLGIGTAMLVKPLAVVLVPAYGAAIVVFRFLERRAQRQPVSLGRYGLTWAMFSVGGALLAIWSIVAADGPSAVLGSYSVVLGNIDFGTLPIWFVRHLADLDLYLAVIPFVATLLVLVTAVRRSPSRRTSSFASITVPAIVLLTLAVAAYASKPNAGAEGYGSSTARLHERAVFMCVPLLLIGLALWIESGLPRRGRLAWACVAAGLVLPVFLPLSELSSNANFQAMALVPWVILDSVAVWPLGGVLLAALGVWQLLTVRAEKSSRLWLIVAGCLAVVAITTFGSMRWSATKAVTMADFGERTWIDDTVHGGTAIVVWDEDAGSVNDRRYHALRRIVWLNEFFNRNVGRVYEVGRKMPYNLPSADASFERGVLVDSRGTPVTADYVLTDCTLRLEGSAVATGLHAQALLYRVDGLIRKRGGSNACGATGTGGA